MRRSRRGPSRKNPPNYVAYGVVMIAAVLAIVWFSFAKRVPGVPRYQVRAVVANSNQLKPHSPVRIAGVKVGEVAGIDDGPGQGQTLKLVLDKGAAKLRQDARLKVRPRMFLEGGFYVDLAPGSPSAPALRSGATLPADRASAPVQFDQLLATLDLPTRDGLKATFAELSHALTGGGAKGFQRFAWTLAPTVHSVAISSDALAGRRPHDVSQLITYAGRTVRALDSGNRALVGVLDGLDRTAGATAAESRSLTATLRGLDATFRGTPATLRAVDRALPELRRASRALRPALPQAPATLRAGAALVRQVDALLAPSELPRATQVAAPLVHELPRLSDRLSVLLPSVTSVTGCVKDHALPVLTSTIRDGHLTTNRPVWLDLAHSLVALAGATANFDANGNYIRLLGQFGTTSVVTGQIPEEGQVFSGGLGGQLGSRPTPLPPGSTPPFRPDVDCATQALPDLSAQTAPVDFTPAARASATPAAQSPSLIKKLDRVLGKLRK
jgi:phospholipid/cholesterol/gamma-HCH transport system substrate-binding protein